MPLDLFPDVNYYFDTYHLMYLIQVNGGMVTVPHDVSPDIRIRMENQFKVVILEGCGKFGFWVNSPMSKGILQIDRDLFGLVDGESKIVVVIYPLLHFFSVDHDVSLNITLFNEFNMLFQAFKNDITVTEIEHITI